MRTNYWKTNLKAILCGKDIAFAQNEKLFKVALLVADRDYGDEDFVFPILNNLSLGTAPELQKEKYHCKIPKEDILLQFQKISLI